MTEDVIEISESVANTVASRVDTSSVSDRSNARKTSKVIKNARLARSMHINSVIFTLLGASGIVAAIAIALLTESHAQQGFAIFLIFYCLVGVGLTLGYHRHFTHCSFKAKPWLRAMLGILGCMAGQGPIIFWAALHRRHHELSDRDGDPHSPNLSGQGFLGRLRGVFHAYIGWTVKHEVPNANFYTRDLLADPVVSTVNRYYFYWIGLGFLLPALLGWYWIGGWIGALEGFVWGGLIRMFALHNMIWWITSFAHVFGKREYRSRDLSTNNVWLAIPTLGESWHNSHHAFPRAAVLNFSWWQLDLSGALLRVWEKLGWAWDLYVPNEMERRNRRADSVSS